MCWARRVRPALPGRARAVADMSDAREVLRQARTGADDMHLRSLAAAEIVLASALSVSIDARAARPLLGDGGETPRDAAA
jgi:hypothetical protein